MKLVNIGNGLRNPEYPKSSNSKTFTSHLNAIEVFSLKIENWLSLQTYIIQPLLVNFGFQSLQKLGKQRQLSQRSVELVRAYFGGLAVLNQL